MEFDDEKTLTDYLYQNPGNLFGLNNKFDYEDKRFCFNCKLDAEQLMKQKKKLKTCSVCQIAQYCSMECQRKEYASHKQWCILVVKRQRKLRDKSKKILEEKGYDVNRSVLERGVIIDLGQVFLTYQNSNMNTVEALGKCRFGGNQKLYPFSLIYLLLTI